MIVAYSTKAKDECIATCEGQPDVLNTRYRRDSSESIMSTEQYDR
jgi:hypothetical protein